MPKVVREALGVKEGDEIVFRVEGNHAVLARTPDFLSLAGVPRDSSPAAITTRVGAAPSAATSGR